MGDEERSALPSGVSVPRLYTICILSRTAQYSPGVGDLDATARRGRQWVQATSCWAVECSQEDWCKPPLGPLTNADPDSPQASGPADSKTAAQPRSGRGGAKGQKRAPPARARSQKSVAPRASQQDGGCSGLVHAAACAKG